MNTQEIERDFPTEITDESLGNILLDLFRIIGSRLFPNSPRRQRRYIKKFAGRVKGNELSFGQMDAIVQKISKYGGTEIAEIGSDSRYWKQFQVLLSGMLSLMNESHMDALATDTRNEESKYNQERLSRERYVLSVSWGIHNEMTALKTLLWLFTEGHSLDYELSAFTYTEHDELPEHSDDNQSHRGHSFYNYFSSKYTPAAMRAWDIGRAANIVRWCYTVGYLDEQIAWKSMDYIGRLAVSSFHSFADFAKSYAFGRLFWLYGNTYDPKEYLSEVMRLLKTTNRLFNRRNGAWRINPWPKKIIYPSGEMPMNKELDNDLVLLEIKQRFTYQKQCWNDDILKTLKRLGPISRNVSRFKAERYDELLCALEEPISMEDGWALISILPPNIYDNDLLEDFPLEWIIESKIETIQLDDRKSIEEYEKLIDSCPNENVKYNLIANLMALGRS